MSTPDSESLRAIKTLPQLLAYLRNDLDWPIENENVDDLTFDYHPSELGLDTVAAVKIKEIKQLRPLTGQQPWGIFWINFEKKRLPVVVMRRILRALVVKKRSASNQSERKAWQPSDLLFISAYGEETDRAITMAHFVEDEKQGNLAELRVLGWDDDDTPLKYDYIVRTLSEKLRWQDRFEGDSDLWRNSWRSAFTMRHREVITTSNELALALATLAKRIRGRVRSILRNEDGFGEIRKLQRAFQKGLIHDLDDDAFADMLAQTVTYGLFSVSVRRTFPGEGTAVTKDDVPNMILTSPFLREMLNVFLGIKTRKGKLDFDELGISDVTDLLQSPDTHMDAVLRDFGNRTQQEDPVIHFYEHFLTEYDKKRKVQRGVFYTPQPVVSYIVRSVHELLQTEFGLADGLADTTTWGEMVKRNPSLKLPPLTDEPGEERTVSPDEPFVQILDPATGTATFLVEVIDVIFTHLKKKWIGLGKKPAEITKLWNAYVPKSLLTRLHAYELMMAPYAIAHMKIGLKLAETGYTFGSNERARIYLTNALEPKVRQLPMIGFEALAHEAKEVNEIKWNKRFTVVIGNPPYAGHSSNKGQWISKLVNDYYKVDGAPLGERNSKWLQDDYVKFIRLGQNCISQSGCGIESYITNHGYIENPTFRGMRQSLLKQFKSITILDLHGSTTKKEKSPDGSDDTNVFDIKQGVAVFLAVLLPQSVNTAKIMHSHLFGTRDKKYKVLSGDNENIAYRIAYPSIPFYLFTPQDNDLKTEYDNAFPMLHVMPVNVLGFQTHRDNLAIDIDKTALFKRIHACRETVLTDLQIQQQYEISDNSDWKVKDFRKKLRADDNWKSAIILCSYRPFDFRFSYFSTIVMDRPRRELIDHVAHRDNLCLGLGRQGMAVQDPIWSLISISKYPIDANIFRRGGINVFPLYLYPESDGLAFNTEKQHNFSPAFLNRLGVTLALRQKSNSELPAGLSPEDVLNYIYAVFHSPTYRTRYADFLKIDFPSLPLTASLALFRALAKLGGELVALHLMESPNLNKHSTKWVGGKNEEVEKISYTDDTVWINKAQSIGFQGVPEAVWNFHIGGYQVCEKWLKDRKGRTLSADDIEHYHKIVVSLSETIRLMAEIDAVIDTHGGWPGAFAVNAQTEPTA